MATTSLFSCPRRLTHSVQDYIHESDGTCSYCGSLNPHEFMRRLRIGDVVLEPTDKSYKVYMINKGGRHFDQTFREDDRIVTREVDSVKFYFQHLDISYMREFVDLYNAKKIQCAYPGYFYELPFFIQRNV